MKAYLFILCAYMLLSRFSHIWLFVTPGTVAHQAPLSMGFSWQEYWSGLPCPSLGDLPDPGIEPTSPASPELQVDSLLLSYQGSLCTYVKHTNNIVQWAPYYFFHPTLFLRSIHIVLRWSSLWLLSAVWHSLLCIYHATQLYSLTSRLS